MRRKGHPPGATIPVNWNRSARPPAISTPWWLSPRHLRFASVHAYIAAIYLKLWKKALREAERELDAATTRTALDAAAEKFMRVKAELKRLQEGSA
jgi:hypothetical protein